MNICLKCTTKITNASVYGLHEDCFAAWFDVPASESFYDLDPKTSSVNPSHFEIRKDTFFHGRYLKYSARLGLTQYILKIQEEGFPELQQIEYLCNNIANLLNIMIPSYYLIDFNGRTAFVTRNFMQDHTGTLHHIYKFLPKGEENHCCEEIMKVILSQTGCPSEIVKFIEMCLFDALIGNHDRHGRNLGIIETNKGKILAPMYDNPSILGIQEPFLLGMQFNPSGAIWTKHSNEPKPRDYIEEFSRLGYSNIVNGFCKKLISQTSVISNIIQNAFLSEKMKTAFLRLIESRISEFKYG